MALSLIKRRQDAERARIEAYEASLRRVSQRARPAPDFLNALAEASLGLAADVVRPPEAWRPQMKTRDPARLRLAAARHLFARYVVPAHLEQVWLDASGLVPDEVALRRRWYVVVAGGGSLYREGAGEWLSRKEVHAFLNPGAPVSFEAAFCRAIAQSCTDDAGLALRIAHSRLAEVPREELGFWREVVRFFCANPVPVAEMDDLRDFLADCLRRDPAYRIKGRTLASLGRQMRQWHRELEAIARIEEAQRRAEAARARARGVPVEPSAGGRWPGAQIADWSWRPSSKDRSSREEYVIVQLRTAADLVAETQAMRHCVASYATKCIAGHASIWSLRRCAGGGSQRLLTIEVDARARAVQVRGFANRPAHADEARLLERWARARGIELV